MDWIELTISVYIGLSTVLIFRQDVGKLPQLTYQISFEEKPNFIPVVYQWQCLPKGITSVCTLCKWAYYIQRFSVLCTEWYDPANYIYEWIFQVKQYMLFQNFYCVTTTSRNVLRTGMSLFNNCYTCIKAVMQLHIYLVKI